jgi:hypothetical protein
MALCAFSQENLIYFSSISFFFFLDLLIFQFDHINGNYKDIHPQIRIKIYIAYRKLSPFHHQPAVLGWYGLRVNSGKEKNVRLVWRGELPVILGIILVFFAGKSDILGAENDRYQIEVLFFQFVLFHAE